MRWFFYLLVLTNLSLAAWYTWREQAAQPEPQLPHPDYLHGGLQLLSELPPQSLQPTQPLPDIPETAISEQIADSSASEPELPPADTVQNGAAASCMRIAPLAKEAEVEALTHQLAEAKLTVIESGEGFADRLTYWVLVPPYKTDKAAREAATLLAKAKVRDFLVIRSGEQVNGISLGLFSQKEGAENRLQEILALKLKIRKPVIKLRTASVRSHWLVARAPAGVTIPKSVQVQLDEWGLQIAPVTCP